MKERPDIGVYVKDLSAYVVNNADDMDKTMTTGNKNSKFCFYYCGKNFRDSELPLGRGSRYSSVPSRPLFSVL